MSFNIQVISVKLQRGDNTVSWGFNVQGGKEFHSPLVIQKVNHNSLAERGSIKVGDYILRIGNIIAENLTHNQARDAIIRQGNNLELTLQRGAPPRAEDYVIKYDFPQHQLMNSDQAPGAASSLSPQVGLQLGPNKALLTQSYNSPMGLYSSQNIADTLATTVNNLKLNDANLMQAAQNIKHNPNIISSTSLNLKKPGTTTNATSSTASPLPYQALQKSSIAAGGLAFHPPSPAPLSSPHHYNQPSFNYQRPLPSAAAPATSSNIAPQPFRNSNLSTNIHGGQRNINRGTKGSAMLNSNPISANLPTCAACYQLIRGPFISAVGKIWCPNHFVCAHPSCGVNLIDVGFVEENNKLYCESDFEKYFAPKCHKCHATIMGECCYALEKSFHPDCFVCAKCKQPFGSASFHMEDGVPYCTRDFNALFATKCAGCQFPIEAGDKFLEAINQKYHVECFICSTCNVPLGTGGFAAKGNKPYCRKHAY